MKKLILIFSLLIAAPPVGAAEYFVLPAAIRLEGTGGIYGAAAGAQKIWGDRAKVFAGASQGEVQSAGILLTDIPLGTDNLGLNLGFGNVSKARFQTSFSRGLDQANQFEQEISATGYIATIDWRLFSKTLKISGGLVISEIKLNDYFLDGQRIIRPNTKGYHPIKTTSQILSIDLDKSSEQATRGFKVGVGLATAEGRVGQSDMLVSNWRGSVYLPVSNSLTWASHARWSDSYLTKKASNYTSVGQVKSALATDCAIIVDAGEQNQCQLLEDSVANFVASSNENGTAAPIGGSNGLRAYDELSVRAGHSRILSTELRWRVAELDSVQVAITPFYDLGWSSDSSSNIFDRAIDSYGIGLRATYKEVPLRLAYAESKLNSAWFFTVGHIF